MRTPIRSLFSMHRPIRNPFIRHPWICLAAMVLAGAPLWMRLGDFRVRSDADILLEGDRRTQAAYGLLKAAVTDQVVLLINMRCDDVFTAGNLEVMEEVSFEFSLLDGVIDVKSFTHSHLPVWRGFGFEFIPYLPDDRSEEALGKTKEFSIKHPLVRNILVSPDARNAAIAVTFGPGHFEDREVRDAFAANVDAILARHAAPGIGFTTFCVPMAESELRHVFWRDLRVFGMCALAFVTLALALYLRSWRLFAFVVVGQVAFLSLLPGIFGLAPWLLAAVRKAGVAAGLSHLPDPADFRLGVFAVVLFPLLLAVQLTLLAHLCHGFRDFLRRGHAPPDAARRALRRVGKSCFFASLTTAVGLLSMSMSELSQAQRFGVLGCVGVLAGFLFAFGPGVSLLLVFHTGFRGGTPPLERENAERGFVRLAGFAARRGGAMLVLSLVLALAVLPGIGLLSTDIRITGFLPKHSRARTGAEEFERAYNGVNFLRIEIDSGKPGGIADLGYVRFVMKLQEFAERCEGVTGVYSYASIMAMAYQVYKKWDPDAYKLPPNQLLLSIFDAGLRSQEFPFTSALHDPARRVSYLFIRSRDMPSTDYIDFVRKLDAFAGESCPEPIKVSTRTGLHSFLESDRMVVRSQVRTMLVTLGVVFGFLLLLWRACVPALLATLLTAAPVGMALGVAGFLGITLNSITFMMAPIVMGIAVDDAVHFLTYWRQRRKAGDGRLLALATTLGVKGSPIVFTSIVLAGVFGLFALTSFPPSRAFGFLAAVAFVVTLGTVMVTLPAMLAFRRKGMRQ